MKPRPDIIKIGALIFDERQRLLIVRPKTNPFWLFVGGKLEQGEDALSCLRREVREELGVELAGSPRFYLKSPVESAAGDPRGRTIQIHAYFADLAAAPTPSSEIEQLHWLSRDDFEAGQFRMGSILNDHVVPRLIQEGLLR